MIMLNQILISAIVLGVFSSTTVVTIHGFSTVPTFIGSTQQQQSRVLPPTWSFATTQLFASPKSAKGGSSGSSSSAGSTSDDISIKDITKSSEEKMDKSIDSVKINLNTIRTGRAAPNLLDRVRVEYYGTLTPLNQLASISVPSSQQLLVEPYDKSALRAIERGIVESDIGLTPSSSDGSSIRINIPPLTEDRRKDMIKQCKSIGEDGKVAVRNVRRDGVDAIKKLEKDKTSGIGEDEIKDAIDTMQKLTDKKIKDIDDIVSKKEKEVMTV